MRQLMRNRSTNKALLVVAMAVCFVFSSFAVVVEKPQQQTLRATTSTYVHDLGLKMHNQGQHQRELLSVLSLTHRAFVLAPITMGTPYTIVNRTQAELALNPTYRILVRANLYKYDQLLNLATSLANRHNGQTVKVKFWTDVNKMPKHVEDHGFTITPNETGGTNTTYDYNI